MNTLTQISYKTAGIKGYADKKLISSRVVSSPETAEFDGQRVHTQSEKIRNNRLYIYIKATEDSRRSVGCIQPDDPVRLSKINLKKKEKIKK